MSDLQGLDPILRFGFSCHDDHVVVRLDGDLDVTSVADACLALELGAATHTRFTVDCSGLQFLDAAGLRFLISAHRQVQASGGDLIVSDPLAIVHRLLEVAGWPSLVSLQKRDYPGFTCHIVDDLAATCQGAVAAALRISGASTGNLQLVDPSTGHLRIVAQRGFGQPFLDYFATVRDTSSACGTALSLGVPVWVDDVAQSPIFADPATREVMLGAGCRAVASLPICAPDGTMIAMLSVHHDQPANWPSWPRFQLEQLARLTGQLVSRQLPVA